MAALARVWQILRNHFQILKITTEINQFVIFFDHFWQITPGSSFDSFA